MVYQLDLVLTCYDYPINLMVLRCSDQSGYFSSDPWVCCMYEADLCKHLDIFRVAKDWQSLGWCCEQALFADVRYINVRYGGTLQPTRGFGPVSSRPGTRDTRHRKVRLSIHASRQDDQNE